MVEQAVPPVPVADNDSEMTEQGALPVQVANSGAEPSPLVAPATDSKGSMAAFHATLKEVTPHVVIVPAITAANVIVFAAMVSLGVDVFAPTNESIRFWGANYGPNTLGGQPWRLITSVFLHIGIIHLAVNMIALWQAGRIVERIFGALAFSAIYLAAGLAGSIASLAIHPLTLSAGASGAVFGVYGALAAFLVLHRGVIPALALSRLQWVAFSFIIFNIQNGLTHQSIDNAAHVGGLLGGAIAGALLSRPLAPGRPDDRARPIYVAGAAVVLASIALLTIHRPVDLDEVLNRFSAVEKPTLKSYQALRLKVKNNELNDNEFASAIEREVLVPWRGAHAQLGVHPGWTPAQVYLFELVQRYASARERDWTLIVDALRTGDRTKLDEAKQVETEIQTLLDAMKDPKPNRP